MLTIPRRPDNGDRQAGAFDASSIAPPLDLRYDYDPHTPVEVAFGHYVSGDDGAAHPSSAFGVLHYLPPAAISKKYYTLQDPNVCATHEPATVTSSYSAPPPSPPPTAFDSELSCLDGTTTVTSSPAPKLEAYEDEEQHASAAAPAPALPPSPFDATPTLTPTPSPAYYQETFRFAPSGPPECAHPVLPKQRRNRDDPGGDADRLAQVRELEVGPALLCFGQNVRLTRAHVSVGPDGSWLSLRRGGRSGRGRLPP